ARHRVHHRRAETEQRLVRVGFLRPFVDELGEVAGVAERVAVGGQERRPHRLDVLEAHQIAALALDVADAAAGQRLERAAEPPPAPPGGLPPPPPPSPAAPPGPPPPLPCAPP